MTFLDMAAMSYAALLKHKLRSALTLLGIVIGIISVSSITSVVRGVDRYMATLFGSMGSEGFAVTKIGMPMGEEEYWKALKRKDIRPDVAATLKRECPSVLHVAPFVRTLAKVKSGRLSAEDVYIEGTTEDAQYMTDIGLDVGRYFTPYEVEHASAVCIIGADVAEKIFAGPDPTGRTVYIKGHRFTVIGSHARMGTILGISRDSFVYIPYTTFERVFGRGFDAEISVRARGPRLVGQATEEVRGVMRNVRRLGPGKEDDFGIITSDALLQMWRRLSANIFLAMVGVGSISLVVGGIGIMNIMFVSVKERTNEIGVRKAIGATRRQIMLQFLTESSVLCLVGGIVGVGVGVGAAELLAWKTRVPVAAEWWAMGLSLVVSVCVGLFFGVYPAIKASSLDPVDALRYGQ
ncbi:MAG: ABC transporter permease [Candidatus Eisenbacteria bacterium]